MGWSYLGRDDDAADEEDEDEGEIVEQMDFDVADGDLVEVRTGETSYGVIIFGKVRVRGVKFPDGEEAYVHVRVHDPPNKVG